jgi:hypothetical protein
MEFLRAAIYVTGITLLAGCAAAPRPLQQLGEDQYAYFGETYAELVLCTRLDRLSRESASIGIADWSSRVAGYEADAQRLSASIRKSLSEPVSVRRCSDLASALADRKAQINVATQSAAADSKSRELDRKAWDEVLNKPKTNMSCVTVGVQTLCRAI